MTATLESFRQQLARLLDLVDEENLAPIDRDALATGIQVARSSGDDLKLPKLEQRQPQAFELGERILYQLAEADTELEPREVSELETLFDERLPETL